MQIQVHLFAAAAELANCRQITVEVAEPATLADVAQVLAGAVPALQSLIAISRWAVDQDFMPLSTAISPQQEIALIPPVSGG